MLSLVYVGHAKTGRTATNITQILVSNVSSKKSSRALNRSLIPKPPSTPSPKYLDQEALLGLRSVSGLRVLEPCSWGVLRTRLPSTRTQNTNSSFHGCPPQKQALFVFRNSRFGGHATDRGMKGAEPFPFHLEALPWRLRGDLAPNRQGTVPFMM